MTATVHPHVPVSVRNRVYPHLRRSGIRPSPLVWHLVTLIVRSSGLSADDRRHRELDADIAQAQVDVRNELLGPPAETRGVRRNPRELDRVETAVEAFTDDLRTLFTR